MSRASYSAISSYSRVEILHLLQAQPGRTIQDLSDRTGLHANTVREHLQRLMAAGHVVQQSEHRTTRGRPRSLYSAATGAPGASSPVARRRVQDAARRGDLMRRVIPETVGTVDGAAMHQLDAVVDDLIGAGFDPVVDEVALTIDLSPCPHATAQNEHLETLCHVHIGLMQSVLKEAKGPLRIDGLAPRCDPETCIVHLTR